VPETEEQEILVRASQGDLDAFGALYERYVERIFNYVYYRTGDVHDAEDLTARVFYRALNHIKSYTDRSRHQEIPLSEAPTLYYKGEPPEMALMQSQDRDAILKLVRRLPSERQHLLVLKFVEHLSNAEIGEIMGRSEGAVKSLYHRTLLALRDDLDGVEIDEE